MKKINWEHFRTVFFLSMALIGVFLSYQKCENEKYLMNEGIETVGKLTRIRGDVEYEYFVEGIKYTSHDTKTNDIEIKVGRCYEVQYDSKNPQNSDIDLDKEVPCPKQLK